MVSSAFERVYYAPGWASSAEVLRVQGLASNGNVTCLSDFDVGGVGLRRGGRRGSVSVGHGGGGGWWRPGGRGWSVEEKRRMPCLALSSGGCLYTSLVLRIQVPVQGAVGHLFSVFKMLRFCSHGLSGLDD
jgi:hypothetical protein